MDRIELYTDGACSGNPGPGGWAYLMRWKGIEKKENGCAKHTTNNKMELMGVIEGLKTIKRPVNIIELYSDSQYVVKGINEWLEGWKNRNFKNVKNPELWHELSNLIDSKCDKFIANWVRGHNGHKENEIVDGMAVDAIKHCK